ncbi:MAG: hypothetical protein QOE01_1315 [Actinomycetota bacterium]|nr:hypothetical protein [Actinomycetota bacterium]
MVAQFRRARKGGISVTFGKAEARVLRHVLAEMLELLGPAEEADADPLAAIVGIGTATSVPEDPALARLFPDGYHDDPEASADFRRYTEPDLRQSKRAALQAALDSMGEPGDRVELSTEQAELWLRALNDTRLVLGERLGVTEDLEALVAGLSEDDPRLGLFWVYDRLTYWQESLVQALMGHLHLG